MTCSLPSLERMLMASVLALLLWLPLPQGSNRDWSVALLVLFCALLGLGWAINRYRRNRAVSPTLKAALPMLGLLLLAQLWVLIQCLTGRTSDLAASFEALMLGLAYCLLFLTVVDLFRTRKRLSLLLGCLVVSGTVQAFYGAAMTLSGVEWGFFEEKRAYIGHATGTFINRNHLAGYLELTTAAGIGLLLALRDERPFSWVNLLEMLMGPKARLRLALVMMVIALVMSHSRMGNTAFFASLLLVGGLFLLLNPQHRLRNGLILASLILIDLLIISQYFGLEKLAQRLSSTHVQAEMTTQGVVLEANDLRAAVVEDAVGLLERRWWDGYGAGSFEVVFPQVAGPRIGPAFDHAHNDYLQFLIEYGALGTLPLAAFVALALYHAGRAMWMRESTYRSGVGAGVLLALLALLIHSFVDFNLQIPANAATFVVFCALSVLASEHFRERRSRPR